MRRILNPKVLVVITLVAALSFGVGVMFNNNDEGGHMSGHMNNAQGNNDTFSSSEIMFAQMMIPHHEQAVEMSSLALSISKNPNVLAIAEQIKDAQAPEIEQMKLWLEKAGAGTVMDHQMAMDGMLSESEIALLAGSTGEAFDRLFLAGMIAHHEGAISMTSMIDDSDNSEVRKLAEDIKKSQSAEIIVMESLLADL